MTATAETTSAGTSIPATLPAGPRSTVRVLLRVLGPAWIVMLADVDAPSILTAAKAGTDFGYAILLPVLALIPVLYLVQVSSDRALLGPLANARRRAALLWTLTAGLLGLGLTSALGLLGPGA
ncbi:MAG TPA: hypothetical protein VF494_04420 [Candidatus Limnocylindrales bacterium]